MALELSRTSHTVSAMINGLERGGMVFRLRKSETDRRQVWVSMTSTGLDRLSHFDNAADSIAGSLQPDPLDEHSKKRVSRAITDLVEILGQ